MIAVSGATGLMGLELCRQLVDKGRKVRGLVRKTSDASKVAELRSLGVEVVEGDLKDKATLGPLVAGADIVITTATSTTSRTDSDTIWTVDRDGSLNLVEVAAKAKVKQFIFTSFPPMKEDFPLQQAKRVVEARLRDGDMPYTIMQPVNFMEVWLSARVGFDIANRKARLFGPGTAGNNWICFRDVAKFLVAAVDNPKAINQTFAFGGVEALGQIEVVKTYEELGHGPWEVENVPMEALFAMKQGAKTLMDETAAGLMINCARGDNLDMPKVLEVLPVEPITIRQWAEGVLADMKKAAD